MEENCYKTKNSEKKTYCYVQNNSFRITYGILDQNPTMIFVIDFGGQTAHLITRRLKDLGVPSMLVDPDEAYQKAKIENPAGIIFSGGPASVYEKGAPTIGKKVLNLPLPMLDICYGLQLRSHLLGGKVKSGTKEYGPAKIALGNGNHKSKILKGLPKKFTVWMSHGDSVLSVPKNFKLIGSSETVKYAFIADEKKRQYGVQFHPEIEHTEFGTKILDNFITICGITRKQQKLNAKEMIENIKKIVGKAQVIGAVSGGLDSTVAATLVARAVGKQLIPIHINSGLMRSGTHEAVRHYFRDVLKIQPVILNKQSLFLKKLKGKSDPEQKRKAIGKLYIDLFEGEVFKHPRAAFLVQGTIYSDVIESKGTKHADKIKSHHNVGGLPKKMKLSLIEPIRELYTDQVRTFAKELGIPDEIIYQQPHPGPGFAIRILGEVTKERLLLVSKADDIIVEELKKVGWYEKLIHSFAVLTNSKSTAVKGDGRVFGDVIAIRAISSKDRMTADWARLPYDVLQKISSRIVNEVPGISRVVYDITTKPPATMEWE